MRSVDGKARPIYDSGNLYIEPQDGSTIRLTIDATIQEIVEKAMRECYEVNKAQAVHALVMDVYTGAVLAMCSKPDYDPNDPPREQLDALQSLMRIRLISDSYEPGSTFKILTAAAALDSGVTTPEDGFYCSGKIKVDGDTIKRWGSPHKAETMAQALQNSCNPVFVELALRMGAQRFYQYLHAFGLGSKTNIDLQGEESGILIPVNSVKNVDLARIGFGQSVAVTPIQLLDRRLLRSQRRTAHAALSAERSRLPGRNRPLPHLAQGGLHAHFGGNLPDHAQAAGGCGGRRRREERPHSRLPHRRQDGYGAGVQGRPHRAERSHRFVSGLCPGR